MLTVAQQAGVVKTIFLYWCVAHRMMLTAVSIVWCRMLKRRDGENGGESGRGLI